MVTQNKCQQQNVIMRYETSNRVCKQKKKKKYSERKHWKANKTI